MMDILNLVGSAFAGGVSSVMLLYRLFPSKSEFEKLSAQVDSMKKEYVTEEKLQLILTNIKYQLETIVSSLSELKEKNGGQKGV